jgi:hypothetical protein
MPQTCLSPARRSRRQASTTHLAFSLPSRRRCPGARIDRQATSGIPAWLADSAEKLQFATTAMPPVLTESSWRASPTCYSTSYECHRARRRPRLLDHPPPPTLRVTSWTAAAPNKLFSLCSWTTAVHRRSPLGVRVRSTLYTLRAPRGVVLSSVWLQYTSVEPPPGVFAKLSSDESNSSP